MQSASDDFALLSEKNIKHEVQAPVATSMASSAHQVCSYSEYSKSCVQDQGEENQRVSALKSTSSGSLDVDSPILYKGSARTGIPWIRRRNELPEMRAVPAPSMTGTEPIPRLSGRIDMLPITELQSESRATTGALELFQYHLHISWKCTFTFDKVIGSGMMGSVMLASHDQNPRLKYAVKSFDIEFQRTAEMNRRLFFKEISILNKLSHPHIMKPVFEVHCPKRLLMIMPYYPRGNLRTALTRANMVPYFGQLCDAMAYLYTRKVAHLDIKLENILVTEDQRIILTDFGLSKELTTYDDRIAFQKGGTNAYWAPECYQENATVNLFKLDSYAVGVILWAFIFERVPHETVNYLGTVRERFCERHPLIMCAEKLLDEDPNKRVVMPTFNNYWVSHVLHRESAQIQEGSSAASGFSRTNSST